MKKLLSLLAAALLIAGCVAVPPAEPVREQAAAGGITAVSAAIGGGYGSTGCTLSSAGALSCDGAAVLNGGLTMDTNKFTVADASGNVATAGTLAVTGASTLTGAVTTAGDVTISPDASGGNLGAKTELSGLVRIKQVALGTMTNGTTETVNYVDDSPDGEWTAITTTVTVSANASIYRIGSKSLKLAFSAAAANDQGAVTDITNDDLSSNESIGFWIYSDTVLAAGDLDVLIDDTDASPDSTFDVCEVPTVNVWTWCKVDIQALDGTTGNVVDKVGFVLKNAAGLAAFNVYIDGMYKWDSTDEEALGTAIVPDGVYSVLAVATAENAPNTLTTLAAGTDYFIHYDYELTNDFLVTITDQSANSGIALIGY